MTLEKRNGKSDVSSPHKKNGALAIVTQAAHDAFLSCVRKESKDLRWKKKQPLPEQTSLSGTLSDLHLETLDIVEAILDAESALREHGYPFQELSPAQEDALVGKTHFTLREFSERLYRLLCKE